MLTLRLHVVVVLAFGDLDSIFLLSMAQRDAHLRGAAWARMSVSALSNMRVLRTRSRRDLASSW